MCDRARPSALLLYCLLIAVVLGEDVTVEFHNLLSSSVSLSWIQPGTNTKTEVASITPRGQHNEKTGIGHEFELNFMDEQKQERRLLVKVINHGRVEVNCEGDRGCRADEYWQLLIPQAQQDSFAAACIADLTRSASEADTLGVEEDAETFCRKFPSRAHVVERHRVTEWPDQRMLGEIEHEARVTRTQPQAFHNYTKLGFRLLKKEKDWGGMMDSSFQDAHQRLTQWYEDNRHHARPEQAADLYDSILTSYENDIFFAQPPEELIGVVAAGVQRALEDWAQIERGSLKRTAVYGIRMYRRNASLKFHVDIWETHVLSAILSIGQRGMDRPWPLEIRDHSGKMQKVKDKAGDVVLYESATCEHGRTELLRGREFANIFMHFAPKSGWGPKYPELIAHENLKGSLQTMKFEL